MDYKQIKEMADETWDNIDKNGVTLTYRSIYFMIDARFFLGEIVEAVQNKVEIDKGWLVLHAQELINTINYKKTD